MSNYLTLRSNNLPAGVVNMVYSTLTGSSIVGSTIRVSTIVGSTLTMNTSVVGSTLTGSTITVTGSVGIGTTATSGDRLAIAGTVRQAGTYILGDAITPVNGLLRMVALSGQTYIQSGLTETSDSKADLAFTSINAGTEWMRIRSNGNVGIGTTAPSALLHLKPTGSAMRITGNLPNTSTRPALSQTPGTYEIRGSGIPDTSDDGFLRLSAGAGTTLGTISCIDISGYYTTSEMNSNIRFVTAATERMRIDLSGNVGIGTTLPAERLSIYTPNTTTPTIASIFNNYVGQNSSGNDYTISALYMGTSSYYGSIQARIAPGGFGDQVRLDFCTPLTNNSNTQAIRMSIMPLSGNVGIGTTAPITTLDVRGTLLFAPNNVAALYSGPTQQSQVVYDYYSSYIGNARWNGSTWSLSTDGVNYSYSLMNYGWRQISFYTGSGINTATITDAAMQASQRMVINQTGTIRFNAYANGSLSIINGDGTVSSSSDIRLKENILYQTNTSDALQQILQLKPATFNFIGGYGTFMGFVAQDVEKVIPLAVDGKKYEWVYETDEKGLPKLDEQGQVIYKLDEQGQRIIRSRGLDNRAIVAVQTLAIQELTKNLDTQQVQLTRIQDRHENQTATITALQSTIAAQAAELDILRTWARTMGFSG